MSGSGVTFSDNHVQACAIESVSLRIVTLWSVDPEEFTMQAPGRAIRVSAGARTRSRTITLRCSSVGCLSTSRASQGPEEVRHFNQNPCDRLAAYIVRHSWCKRPAIPGLFARRRVGCAISCNFDWQTYVAPYAIPADMHAKTGAMEQRCMKSRSNM